MKRNLTTKARRRPRIFREIERLSDRERVMARLAREIGRGRDVIYHGTRHLPDVLRSGKLVPPEAGESAICLTRSPETAAYFASFWGIKLDNFSAGILVLNRRSMVQNYRLEPFRYDEESDRDEREEIIRGRAVNLRRHLLGVVREADVTAILGPPKHRYLPLAFRSWSQARQSAFFQEGILAGDRLVQDGKAKVRNILVHEREQRMGNPSHSQPSRLLARAPNPPKSQRRTHASAHKTLHV